MAILASQTLKAINKLTFAVVALTFITSKHVAILQCVWLPVGITVVWPHDATVRETEHVPSRLASPTGLGTLPMDRKHIYQFLTQHSFDFIFHSILIPILSQMISHLIFKFSFHFQLQNFNLE